MTAVLLVADTERVKRVFADLESKGVLQLHAAATVAQVDQVVAAAIPAFAFVQSRMCGLSADILLRHLKKTLPHNATIVILSADAADVPRRHASETSVVDLRLADDVVAEMVKGIVAGTAAPSTKERGKAGKGKSAKKAPRIKKKDDPGKATANPPRKEETQRTPDFATVEPPPARGGGEAREESRQLPQFTATALFKKQAPSAEEASAAASAFAQSQAGEVEGGGATVSFLEMIEAAASKSDPLKSMSVGDRVCIDTGRGTGDLPHLSHGIPRAAEPPEAEPWLAAGDLLKDRDQVAEETFGGGKKKRWICWSIVLLLAFLIVPPTAYFLGRVAQAPGKGARQQPGKDAGKPSALLAAPASTTSRPPSGAATGAPPVAPKEESPNGLAALPPFLVGLEPDRGYSAGHPGWEHYLGAKAEYKVFREGGRYRAIQAISRGEAIPDQLFRRVLLEFGGIAGYAVKSAEAKGNYLVEQATGSGNASLTIYRKRTDLRIKAMVVYYH